MQGGAQRGHQATPVEDILGVCPYDCAPGETTGFRSSWVDVTATFCSLGVDHETQSCQLLIRSGLLHTLPQALLGDSDSPSQTSTPPGQPGAPGANAFPPRVPPSRPADRDTWQGPGRAPTSRHGF